MDDRRPCSPADVGVARGVAMNTTFRIVAANYTDPDVPLWYRFTAHPVGSTEPPRQLRDFNPSPSYESVLPGGLDEHRGLVTVSVYARRGQTSTHPTDTHHTF